MEVKAKLGLVPSPTTAFTLNVDYVSIVPALADDGDIPNLPVTDHEILAIGAIRRCCMDLAMIDLKNMYDKEYQRLYIQLLDHVVSRNTGKPRTMTTGVETLL